MPRRIVIHAGFHKTGTSTIQQTLKLNRPVLKKVLRSVLRPGMRDVVMAARGFSSDSDLLARARFHNRFGSLLVDQPEMPRRTLCLSAEELSGHMPGRPRTPSYVAAVSLAQDMTQCAQLVFPKAELIFFFTTRDSDSWLESAYWEHVKASNMTMDLEDFVKNYRAAADLDAVVDQIRDAVPARVLRARLEDTMNRRLGPAASLLDVCEVPDDIRSQMTSGPRMNSRLAPEVLEALLNANRTIRDKVRRRAVKDNIMQGAKGLI